MKVFITSTCVAGFALLYALFSTRQAEIELDPGKVLDKGRSITSRSWEFGTLAQALLEFHNPELTVFGENAFPEGLIPKLKEPLSIAGLAYAQALIWTNDTDLLIDGEGELKRSSVHLN
jgi:hypothetical protein